MPEKKRKSERERVGWIWQFTHRRPFCLDVFEEDFLRPFLLKYYQKNRRKNESGVFAVFNINERCRQRRVGGASALPDFLCI
jgi:hypothetical protein